MRGNENGLVSGMFGRLPMTVRPILEWLSTSVPEINACTHMFSA